MIEAAETFQMSESEFREHMEIAGADVVELPDGTLSATGYYAGRANVSYGSYDPATALATLDLV